MFKSLENIDPHIQNIPTCNGSVNVSNKLQGRIFCEIEGVLAHRLDHAFAESHAADSFNNLGGNSLLPAPEGGDFAFNYLQDGKWLVQDAINAQKTETLEYRNGKCPIGKAIEVQNRKSETGKLHFSRTVFPVDISDISGEYGLESVAYRSIDELHAIVPRRMDEFLFSSWSLEQFHPILRIISKCRRRWCADKKESLS